MLQPARRPEPIEQTPPKQPLEIVPIPPDAGKTRLGRALEDFVSYVISHLTSLLAFVLFRVLNRTKVYGREKLPKGRNVLICANHRTMIDSYLIGHLTSWPQSLLRPHLLPFHPAAQENFFRNRLIGWFSTRWKCIPVRRRARDFQALSRMVGALPKGQMIIFPEGTRSRTGELLRGRPGTGKLIRETRCTVVPCYVKGMDQVLPIGTARPRLFKKIRVIFGDPVPVADLLDLPDTKETSQMIIDRVMDHIARLRDQLEALEAEQARVPRFARLQRALALPGQILRRR